MCVFPIRPLHSLKIAKWGKHEENGKNEKKLNEQNLGNYNIII